MKKALIFCLLALVIGCGGGGGGGSSTPVTPSTTFRAIEPGDVWDYNVIVDANRERFTGTQTVAVLLATLDGEPLLKAIITTNLEGELDIREVYLRVLEDGTTETVAQAYEGEVLEVIDSQTVGTQGLFVGANGTTTDTYNDGSTSVFSAHITGTERVTVPAGTFDTWRVNVTMTGDFTQNMAGTRWLAPETSREVKSVVQTEVFDPETEENVGLTLSYYMTDATLAGRSRSSTVMPSALFAVSTSSFADHPGLKGSQ